MHTGKELEAPQVEKWRLSYDPDAPQLGSAQSDSTRVVKVNRRKTNRRKTRPYSTRFKTPTVRYFRTVAPLQTTFFSVPPVL